MASTGTSSEGTISLNLNPMLDVFSILITFLLMSFSTDPINHDIPRDLTLPESKTMVSLDELPSVSATRTELYVGDQKLLDLIDGDVPESARSQGAIFPLYQKLKEFALQAKKVNEELKKKDKLAGLTVEVDKNHNFKLLKRIMISGQQAEFITYKLAVAKESN